MTNQLPRMTAAPKRALGAHSEHVANRDTMAFAIDEADETTWFEWDPPTEEELQMILDQVAVGHGFPPGLPIR